MKILKKVSFMLCCVLTMFMISACAKAEKDLVLSADKLIATRGEVVTLETVFKDDEDKTYSVSDVEYSVVKGEDHVELENNLLTIKQNAVAQEKIEVVATADGKTSNKLEITVSVPLESITISADNITNIVAGNRVKLTKTLNPNDSDISESSVNWVIVKGSDLCEITNDYLYVDYNVSTGEEIKIKAVCGNKESNVLTFTVGYPLEEINLAVVGSTNIENNNSRALSTTFAPSNATNINLSWEFVEGADYCTIYNNIITITNEAPIGSRIVFKAVSGDVESEEVTVIVGTPITEITISSLSDTIVPVGNNVLLNAVVKPNNASMAALRWNVTQGGEYAEVVGNTLVFKNATPIGTIVKVKAESGSVESNELTFQYGVPVTSVSISAAGSLEIVKGNSVGLTAVVTPSNATEKEATWQITKGQEYADIIGSTLVVDADATTGEEIKVKATVGGVDSNELTFTIKPTTEEENSEKFMLSLSEEKITLDKNATSSTVLEVEVYNLNLEKVTDRVLTYTVVEGEEFVSVNPNGYTCGFNILGHGNAVVEVGIVGSDVKEIVNLNVVVPPEKINLPEVFAERTGFVYNFSKVNPNTSAVETLPFVAGVRGTNVCQDVVYSFAHEDGTSGDDVAVWDNGNITFKKLGKVTLTITSDSGSRIETTTSYVFNINEGYNIHTFFELQKLADSSKYNGQQINIVVLEKPDGSANNYEYGYDLVSSAGLKAKADQTLRDVLYGENNNKGNGQRINFVCKSVHINGNQHKIDLSQVRAITKAELDSIKATDSSFDFNSFSGLLTILPWTNTDETLQGSYSAKIYDLDVVGNVSVDYNGEYYGAYPLGVIGTGVSIGSTIHDAVYYVDFKNINVSKCTIGMGLRHVVGNGVVQNIKVENCYANGIEVGSSIVTLKDLTFSSCGASSVELVPLESNSAGENHNQNSYVTFEGYMNMDNNKNNGQTLFFQHYTLPDGTPIPSVVEGILSNYDATQTSHLKKDGKFIFVCFSLLDFSTFVTNNSIYNYPDYQDGGIIKVGDLPKGDNPVDTTHQYVEIDVIIPGIGNVGKALLYNQNYQA